MAIYWINDPHIWSHWSLYCHECKPFWVPSKLMILHFRFSKSVSKDIFNDIIYLSGPLADISRPDIYIFAFLIVNNFLSQRLFYDLCLHSTDDISSRQNFLKWHFTRATYCHKTVVHYQKAIATCPKSQKQLFHQKTYRHKTRGKCHQKSKATISSEDIWSQRHFHKSHLIERARLELTTSVTKRSQFSPLWWNFKSLRHF